MRFLSLALQDFRGFASIRVDLDRDLTVLVGENGSGKTSLLQALVLLAWLGKGDLRLEQLGGSRLIRTGRDRATLTATTREGGHAITRGIVLGRPDDAEEVPGMQTELGPPESFAAAKAAGEISLVVLYSSARTVMPSLYRRVDMQPMETLLGRQLAPRDALSGGMIDFPVFFNWFRLREDLENERKVAQQDFGLRDRDLEAVRTAVARVLAGFSGLHIQRNGLHMVVRRGDAELRLDQLSDGERTVLALVADLARRLSLANPESPNPLDGSAVVLIDEIELHLHPRWQRRVLRDLRQAFPGCQFIVTTHSPQVLSSAPRSSVVLLHDAAAYPVASATAGRDSNAILREVFGVSERPEDDLARLRAVRDLIDAGQLDAARRTIDELAEELSESDDGIMDLRMRVHVAEAGA